MAHSILKLADGSGDPTNESGQGKLYNKAGDPFWIDGSGVVTQLNTGVSPPTTKGDLYTYSTVAARLAVGSNDQVLIADSGETTGNKWDYHGWTELVTWTGTTAASIDISSINQNYTHLKFVAQVRGNSVAANNEPLLLTINGVTTNANYQSARSYVIATGTSGAATYFGTQSGWTASTIATDHVSNYSTLFTDIEIMIPNYTDTNNAKTFNHFQPFALITGAGTMVPANAYFGYYATTPIAITQLTFTPATSTAFVSGSSYSLYGLK